MVDKAIYNTSVAVLMFDAGYPPPILGGKEKQAHLLTRELSRKGHRVEAVSIQHSYATTGMYDGVFVTRIQRNTLVLLRLALHLFQKSQSYRILHVHTPSRMGKLIAIIGSVLGYRVVFKFPNEGMLRNLSFHERLWWKSVIRVCDKFVVLGREPYSDLKDWGVPARKIFLTANGVELRRHVHVVRFKSLKERTSLLFLGRLEPQKRCEDAIRAVGVLRAHHGLAVELRIVGAGSQRTSLEALVRELSLGDYVAFCGSQYDILPYLYSADILVLPSEKEGMSNAILEAMAVGLPVVATDVGSAREQLGSWADQFLTSVGDVDGLVRRVKQLIDDPLLIQDYAEYLRERCRIHFSMEAVAQNYYRLYEKLLQVHTPTSSVSIRCGGLNE